MAGLLECCKTLLFVIIKIALYQPLEKEKLCSEAFTLPNYFHARSFTVYEFDSSIEKHGFAKKNMENLC